MRPLYLKVTVEVLGSAKRRGSYSSVKNELAPIQQLTGPCANAAFPAVCPLCVDTRDFTAILCKAQTPPLANALCAICDDLRLPLKGTSPPSRSHER